MAAIATLLAANGCDVRGAEVYGDDDTHGFFCRMVLTGSSTREQLVAIIEPAARGLLLDWELRDLGTRLKVLIAVSKFGHCLVDLIHKREIGQLPIDNVGVVSNHEAMRKPVEWHGLPQPHPPMEKGKPARSEERRVGKECVSTCKSRGSPVH